MGIVAPLFCDCDKIVIIGFIYQSFLWQL